MHDSLTLGTMWWSVIWVVSVLAGCNATDPGEGFRLVAPIEIRIVSTEACAACERHSVTNFSYQAETVVVPIQPDFVVTPNEIESLRVEHRELDGGSAWAVTVSLEETAAEALHAWARSRSAAGDGRGVLLSIGGHAADLQDPRELGGNLSLGYHESAPGQIDWLVSRVE